jgi:hypothetical protein
MGKVVPIFYDDGLLKVFITNQHLLEKFGVDYS